MSTNLRDRLLARAKEQAASSNQNFRKKPIWPFKPQDGETWTARIVTDGNHLVVLAGHNVLKELPGGKKKSLEYLCFTPFGLPCPMCAAGQAKRDFLCLIMVCKEYKDAKGTVYPIATDDGKTGTITLPDGKKIPANPVRVMLRSPGKGYANHFQLLEMDAEYEEDGGLAGQDMKITRNGSGMDTSYTFIAKRPSPFVKPKGLEEKHAETLEAVMTAIQENDMAALIDLILPVFELPEGINEYPKGADYIGPDGEADGGVTEDNRGSAGEDEEEEPPFTPDKKGTKGATSQTEQEKTARSAGSRRRRAAPAAAASKQSDAAADGDGDEFGDDEED